MFITLYQVFTFVIISIAFFLVLRCYYACFSWHYKYDVMNWIMYRVMLILYMYSVYKYV
jgi:hypothetical protein